MSFETLHTGDFGFGFLTAICLYVVYRIMKGDWLVKKGNEEVGE